MSTKIYNAVDNIFARVIFLQSVRILCGINIPGDYIFPLRSRCNLINWPA